MGRRRTSATTCGANDHGGACGTAADGPVSRSRWAPPPATIDTVGSADTLLFLYAGASCPGAVLRSCDDDSAGSGQARVAAGLGPGTYWVVLDTPGPGEQGPVVLRAGVTPRLPPPNDVPAGAIDITAGGSFAGDTVAATDDVAPSPGCSGDPGGRDVWYTFTLSRQETVYLDTVDGETWDTIFDLRRAPCSAASSSVACANDQCAGHSGGRRSQLVQTLDPGTYCVVVDGNGPLAYGAFTLLFQHAPCAGGRQISADGWYDGTMFGSSNRFAGSCGGAMGADALYSFALCVPTPVTATTCGFGTMTDTVLYFLVGGCAAGDDVACNDDDPACAMPPGASTVAAVLPRGLSFLVVDGRWGVMDGGYWLGISGL